MSTGLRFTLEVDGLPPDAFAVVSFHLNQSLSSLFSLDLSLVSQQFLSLEFAQVLDKMAYLTIWQGDEVQRRVKGVVTWFELGENDKNQMLYSMKVHPPLWRAGLRQNFRIFQNEDIKSILGTMLQENGVTEWSPLFSEPHPSREFCVQYGETDYDFLCRMAAEEGIFFYEEHAYKSTDQSLVLCDTVRHLPESFEIPWNPNTRTEVSTLCISQFRYSAQIRPSSVVTKDYTFKRPGWAGRFEQEGQHQDYQRTQYEVYDYPGRFKSAHGQNFARWQMDGWRNNAETARGMSRSPEIWPGRRIVLTGHPQANLNREWQVVASELHGEQPQAVPGRQGAGTALENHFAVIPADRTWRPQPLLKPLVDGPQSAVVTGPAGEEIFCDEHGRVRVKFNWDRYNPADQDSSCWIRVAQAWAGTGFGHLAIPRVGQEVIVDFLNGDPDQPIIMGRTYHQENRTPGSLPGTKTQMTIRSKTYMGSGFNELKFDDATGREQVYIHAQKNMDTLPKNYLAAFACNNNVIELSTLNHVLITHINRNIINDYLLFLNKNLTCVKPWSRLATPVIACHSRTPEVFRLAANHSKQQPSKPCEAELTRALLFTVLSNFLEQSRFIALLMYILRSSVRDSVCRIIQSDIQHYWNLRIVASSLCLSPSLLKKKLKNENTSYSQIVTECRMRYAVQMLLMDNKNITQVAQLCGYSSTSYFISVFKAFYGLTPLNYLAKQRQKVMW